MYFDNYFLNFFHLRLYILCFCDMNCFFFVYFIFILLNYLKEPLFVLYIFFSSLLILPVV